MSEDRHRHIIAAFAVVGDAVAYEPWTDHEAIGWQRTTLDGAIERVYLVVVDDGIELRHQLGNFDSPNVLHHWQPQTEGETE
jgi:hypothetical protein